MKLLFVNNTIFYRRKCKLFLNKETGLFFTSFLKFNKKVSLFQISQQKTDNDNFANFDISQKGLIIFEVKRFKSKLFSFLKAFFKLQIAILRNDFVYIFYPGPICKIIALFCFLYKKPFGIYVRGEQGINDVLSKLILSKAECVFTISPQFTERIKKINDSTFTIRPMISFDESDYFNERNFVSKDMLNVLYVGRIVFDKGIFELYEAIKVLRDNGVDVRINFVGDGVDFDRLSKLIKEDKMGEFVVLSGMISNKDNLKEIYKGSDVFILPSYHEGFPRVLYEAMIMNIPIITTFVGTIDFLMEDKINCLRIEKENINSIVKAIEMLNNSTNLMETIASGGLETIKKYLSDKELSHSELLNKFLNELYVS